MCWRRPTGFHFFSTLQFHINYIRQFFQWRVYARDVRVKHMIMGIISTSICVVSSSFNYQSIIERGKVLHYLEESLWIIVRIARYFHYFKLWRWTYPRLVGFFVVSFFLPIGFMTNTRVVISCKTHGIRHPYRDKTPTFNTVWERHPGQDMRTSMSVVSFYFIYRRSQS